MGEPRRANKRAKPAPIYWGSDLLKHPCHLLHFTFSFEGNSLTFLSYFAMYYFIEQSCFNFLHALLLACFCFYKKSSKKKKYLGDMYGSF